jgi:hypothetical protein
MADDNVPYRLIPVCRVCVAKRSRRCIAETSRWPRQMAIARASALGTGSTQSR